MLPPKSIAGHGGAMRGMDGIWRDRWGNEIVTETAADATHRRRPLEREYFGLISDHSDPFED